MTQTAQTRPTFSDAELQKRRDFQHSRPLERDETDSLISSDKVEGTKVFATDGEEIGEVSKLVIGKVSGRVEYAVMSFGGFLGIGERYHPLPWDALDYDTERGGYVVNIDKSKLQDAPSYEGSDEGLFDRQFGERIYAYYGVMY